MWHQTNCVVLLCCIQCLGGLRLVEAQVVTLPGLGQLQGTVSTTSWSSRNIFEFRGVRYAQPPSGDRRFKDPVKVAPWTGVVDATKFGQSCPQPGQLLMHARNSLLTSGAERSPRSQGSIDFEDCLSLDVYTPTLSATAKLPVLVYFHGGHFIAGSSSALRPGFLLEKDVVLVCPQYRLGVLGFFSLNTNDAPGNAGLSDQVLALQWVRDNVAVFGGDPARVTIAGSSAGGASVSLHMVSPRAKGLFHQVIAHSGSALAPWAFDATGGGQHSRAVTDLTGCSSSAPANVIANCMRNQSVLALTHAALAYSMVEWRSGRAGFGACQPTLQRATAGVTPFLTSSPEELLQSAKLDPVPLLMGITKHEGIFSLDALYQYFLLPNNLARDVRFLREGLLPSLLSISGVSANSINYLARDAARKYFKATDFTSFTQMTAGLVDLSGVMMVKGPSVRQAELYSKRGSNTFFYTFDYQGQHSLFNRDAFSLPAAQGVTHGDDTIYLFPSPEFPLNDNDTVIAKRMVNLFTNFVTSGKPTPAVSLSSEALARSDVVQKEDTESRQAIAVTESVPVVPAVANESTSGISVADNSSAPSLAIVATEVPVVSNQSIPVEVPVVTSNNQSIPVEVPVVNNQSVPVEVPVVTSNNQSIPVEVPVVSNQSIPVEVPVVNSNNQSIPVEVPVNTNNQSIPVVTSNNQSIPVEVPVVNSNNQSIPVEVPVVTSNQSIPVEVPVDSIQSIPVEVPKATTETTPSVQETTEASKVQPVFVQDVLQWPKFESVKKSYLSVDTQTLVQNDVTSTFTVARTEGLATLK